MLDLVLLEELVVDEKHRAAGIAEDVLDALLLEAAHDNLGAADLAGFDSVHGKPLNDKGLVRCGQGGAAVVDRRIDTLGRPTQPNKNRPRRRATCHPPPANRGSLMRRA